MLQNLNLIHRRKPQVFPQPDFPVWATCLRSLGFVAATSQVAAETGDCFYQGEDAYRFLLEIVCGLHSPILGETEVFGQFKIFADTWKTREPQRATLIQKLLSDAKAVRTRFLTGLGAQSYGGWLKKNVKHQVVHVIGGGQLAHEITPYLCKCASEVHVHVRRSSAVALNGVFVHRLEEHAFTSGALVIAAPVTADEIERWLGDSAKPDAVFDLRETSSDDALVHPRVTNLTAIFTELEQTKRRLQPLIEAAKADIQERTTRLAEDMVVRPLGWDDICA